MSSATDSGLTAGIVLIVVVAVLLIMVCGCLVVSYFSKGDAGEERVGGTRAPPAVADAPPPGCSVVCRVPAAGVY